MSVNISVSSAVSLRSNEELRIGGFVRLSTTDLPGSLSAVLFCQGCPWRCRFCHNTHLIPARGSSEIEWREILEFLNRRRGLLDAVVFSGGEPTMQPALIGAMREVREMGFEIGLHTAGQYPARLKETLELVSWVGMDVKAPLEDMAKIIGRTAQSEKVLKSINEIIASGVAHEFRTTRHAALLSEDEIIKVATLLFNLGAKRYVVQTFRALGCEDQELLTYHCQHGLSSEVEEFVRTKFEEFDVRVI